MTPKHHRLNNFFSNFTPHGRTFSSNFFSLSSKFISLRSWDLGLMGLIWARKREAESVWSGLERDVEIGCCHGMAGGDMWVQDQPNGEWFKNCGGRVLGFKVVLAIEEVWVFIFSSHIRCFWVLNFLGFVLVCSSSVFLSFSFFDTLSLSESSLWGCQWWIWS